MQLFNLDWVKRNIVLPNAPLLTQCTVISGNADFTHRVKELLEAKGINVVGIDLVADPAPQIGSIGNTDTLIYLASHKEFLNAADIVTNELRELESLRLIANRIAERYHEAKTQLWVLTQGVQVPGEQFNTVGLSGSGLWGLGRVIAKEYPSIEVGLIDLPIKPIGDEEITSVLAIMANQHQQREFLVRDQCTWQRQVGPLAVSQEKTEIKQNAHYLITGGFGDTGRILAENLFAAGARHVTLMGHSAPSVNLITESEQRKAQGYNLRLFQGDVADIEDVKAVLRRIDRTGHPLRGIYHLASVVEGALLTTLNSHSVEKIFRQKIAGIWNLHLAAQELSLDGFITFSPLSEIIGVAGQGAEAAANAFVDALMRYRRAIGVPGTAIAWELEGDINNVMDTIIRADIAHYAGLIAGNFSQVALERLIYQQEPMNDIESAFGSKQSDDVMVTSEKPSHEEQRQAMTEIVIEELKKLVAGGNVTADTKLSEIDMDSMSAVTIAQRLRGIIGKLVPMSVFFDDCSISELVEKLKRYF
ncbi:beta-ketoacyl reductase [Photorhabdus noenieputensis]|uniref:beta-ketoacyl reductase n=1 Tax=Photorhabdus noenieputensis TaxID=1208607 RepID=UPI001BD50BC3|nr:beta-ketoacyl reductase [Photorhabdus noenieputensis]MCK3668589.1 beta-ketoacyl reductase [Photorhabdus noenieputensis]